MPPQIVEGKPQEVKHTTREGWLLALIDLLRPMLTAAHYEPPEKLRISCGFPSTRALSNSRRRVGECWSVEAAADGYINILISPVMADPAEIAAVVVHELGHATGIHDHKAKFKTFMTAVGLTGKPTATVAGDRLREDLTRMVAKLGPYPHGAIDKTAGPEKKQTTRMRKIACENGHDPYVLRGARKTLDQGVPDCPVCGNEMLRDEGEDEDESEEAGGN